MALSPTCYCLLGLTGLVAGAHGLYVARTRKFLLIDPLNVFWAGFIVVYVIQALELGVELVPMHSAGTLEASFTWILVAMCGVIAGYESPLGNRLGKRWPKLPPHLSANKITTAAFLSLAAGIYYYVPLVRSAGGLDEWLSVGRGQTDWEQISGYLGLLDPMIAFGITLLVLRCYSMPSSAFLRGLAWLLVATGTLWFMYLGSRSRTLLLIMGVGGAYYLPRRANPSPILAVVCFVLMLVISNFLGANRQSFTNLSFNLDTDLSTAIEAAAPGVRETQGSAITGSELNCVMAVVDLVPDKVDYNYGYALLEFVTRPIPRSLWQDKFYPTLEALLPVFFEGGLSNFWVDTPRGPLLAGPALTFVGYWFAMGGPVALLIAGWMTGVMFRATRGLIDHQNGFAAIIIYCLLLRIAFSDAISTPTHWVFNLPPLFAGAGVAIYFTRESRGVGSPAATRWAS